MNMSKIIEDKLIASLNPEHIELIDESHKHAGHKEAPAGGNSHFSLTIVSTKFIDKNLKQRHLMIYESLDGMIGRDFHALKIKALTPDEL